MAFDYFYGAQSQQFAFYRIPKVLFTDNRFQNISTEGKVLYGLLLDRVSLSMENGWIDDEGRVYIIFTLTTIRQAMNCAEKSAIKYLTELEEFGLIERIRQGFGKGDVIAYQIRQSFKPGEITPEEANEVGYETGMRFTKGKHAFIVATHVDRAHIHNHIIFNSTNLECDRKFRDFWFSGIALQRLSDIICLEHGLSVIPRVKPSERQRRTKYPERVSMRDVIREDILQCLDQKPTDFEKLLKLLQAEGYEIKRGKHTAVCGKGQKRFIRFRSLGEEFTEENLKKVIAGEREPPERNEKVLEQKEAKPKKRKFDLVVDIQEKMAQGKNGGYVRWAKKYNVKQFAESILFLQLHDIHDKETLDALVDGSSAKYHELMKTIKDAEEKMAANKVIKTHIINYAKTRETYIAYRKSGYSKKFYEAHRDEITLHKAAKEAFSKLPDGKIPKVKDLNEEFARLLSEKKAAYSEYKKIKKEIRDYQIAKQNVESFYAAQQSWDIEEDMKKKRHQER